MGTSLTPTGSVCFSSGLEIEDHGMGFVAAFLEP